MVFVLNGFYPQGSPFPPAFWNPLLDDWGLVFRYFFKKAHRNYFPEFLKLKIIFLVTWMTMWSVEFFSHTWHLGSFYCSTLTCRVDFFPCMIWSVSVFVLVYILICRFKSFISEQLPELALDIIISFPLTWASPEMPII